MPAEYEAEILQFHKFVIAARKKSSFELHQIGNMYEVPLTFEVPSNKTLDIKGAKSITIKTSGHQETLHCCVSILC
jgi:hypothetical protein